MEDIRELPVWEDCPFRDKVPEVYQIRRGKFNDEEVFALVYETTEVVKHVAAWFGPDDVERIDGFLVPMVSNLGGAIFKDRHPETFVAMIKREAVWASGGKLNPSIRSRAKQEKRDSELWAEYRSLTELREVS